ncbi:hypothetical protein [Flavihumibacter fluvii]|uniref:hypothetical protein n=1 Tax=Flavihumibacter fluvii TaxID=2838157 RepID=UPI001BDE2550|nr:hypothetical protein [Flavihumibacter fluvii]ULQ50858.1 hypothetical protein KJS93_12265 [Flavihumibacter fluvii]
MKKICTFILIVAIGIGQAVFGQVKPVDKVKFFADETLVNVTLECNWNKVIKEKAKEGRNYPARFISTFPDNTQVNEPVVLEVRGHFRRGECYLPPLKLGFKKSDGSQMHTLKSLKLVSSCKTNATSEQYLLREYLCYKMYNIVTDKSFRARLLKIDYKDSNSNKSVFQGYAFLIEDSDDMAKRNNCRDFSQYQIPPEAADRKHSTLMNLFQYMIGNTDWAVSTNHNIRLIQSLEDTTSRPYTVAYDLDWSGIVNTDYAVPAEMLGTTSVKERVYRGFPRTVEEINEAIAIFNQNKEKIYATINGFEPLTAKNKKSMTDYLDDFFRIINNPKEAKSVFIDNARTE